MQLTSQQAAFVAAVVNGTGHKCLRARAGTGKTSTIMAAVVPYMKAHPTHDIVICAFGKAIQMEIKSKLNKLGIDWKKCDAVTSHSLGFSLVKFMCKGVKVDNAGKVRDLIRSENAPVFQEFFAIIADLVHLAKLEGFGFFDDVQIGDTHAWYGMADHYNVNGFDDTSDMDRVIEAAQHIYKKSLAQTDVIDFDDMILFPLVKGFTTKYKKDVIIVDEGQDTSRARRALFELFLKPGTGRLMIVGDDRQAIMGFAGASADALDEWIAQKQAEVLPLTMTWRCPKAVVAEARRIVPDIVAAEGAIEGSVTRATALPASLELSDAILCRNTAPLVTTAYSLIRQGVACRVEGREIGNGLLRIVDRWKQITTVGAFLAKLGDYRDREVQKAMAKGKESKVTEINDRCDTLVAICDAVKAKKLTSLDAVRKFISDLFCDNVAEGDPEKGRLPMLTLATYHRSKGREWPRVMLLEHSKRCPSPWAKQEWELRQESNLAYVAITRAQRELIYVDPE
jgi:DNA helicase-2/ATP-dependent DNA helicase PcrA